jgi:hypothetical protein
MHQIQQLRKVFWTDNFCRLSQLWRVSCEVTWVPLALGKQESQVVRVPLNRGFIPAQTRKPSSDVMSWRVFRGLLKGLIKCVTFLEHCTFDVSLQIQEVTHSWPKSTTNLIEKNPFWGANSCAVGHEIPLVFVQSRALLPSPEDSVTGWQELSQCQNNPIYNLKIYFLKITVLPIFHLYLNLQNDFIFQLKFC